MNGSSSTPAKPSSIDKSHSIPIATQYAEPSSPGHLTVEIHSNSSGDDAGTDVHSIRVGKWETGLFCCVGSSFGFWVNTCLAWCLPCISFAQITHRFGLAKFWVVLAVFVVTIITEYVVRLNRPTDGAVVPSLMCELATQLINKIYTAATSQELHVENLYLQDTQIVIFVGTGMWSFVGFVTCAAMIVLAWVLRSRVRTRFSIPGSWILDGLAAFFCSCCTVAQLATHLKIHEKRRINLGPADTLPAFPQ